MNRRICEQCVQADGGVMRNFQNKAVLTFWLPACELIWIQHTLIFLWDIQFQLLSKSQGLCIFLCIQQIWLIAFRTELSTDYWRIERPWTWVKWPPHYRVHTWNPGMFSPWSHWLMGARIDILGNRHRQFETRPGNISRRTGCEHCKRLCPSDEDWLFFTVIKNDFH